MFFIKPFSKIMHKGEPKLKAAVCYEFGKPLVVEEVDIDAPRASEVKVRMAATAICHSDINVIRGYAGAKLPIVPGHESAGYIEEVGRDVTSVKPGDAVVVSVLSSCHHCYYCISGYPHLCENSPLPGPENRLRNKRGQTLIQGGRKVAGFAEYTIVDESQIVHIPNDFPMDKASLLACGVITGLGAVVNRAQVRPLSSVVVIGAGGVGLNSVQGAAISGAYPVIVIDVSDYKLEAARVFGATHTVRGDDKNASYIVRQLTHGRGADFVFVTVGNAAAIEQGFSMSSPRGMTVVVGIPPSGSTITVPAYFPGERVLTSSSMGTTRLKIDVPLLIDIYKAGKLKLDELITNRYPLEQINEAIESTERGEALRNVIIFPP